MILPEPIIRALDKFGVQLKIRFLILQLFCDRMVMRKWGSVCGHRNINRDTPQVGFLSPCSVVLVVYHLLVFFFFSKTEQVLFTRRYKLLMVPFSVMEGICFHPADTKEAYW